MFQPNLDRYDAVIAGGRVAGAATAMLLARGGQRVLVVDPARRGSDTLSTHALMRGAVLQLHRWGLLDAVRASGAPVIETTTFHYGEESIQVDIEPRDGIEGLYAPRRWALDRIVVEAAEDAGAEIHFGASLRGVDWDASGRVRGAFIADASGAAVHVGCDLVVGADGRHSRVAKEVGAEVEHLAPHATASVYGYVAGLGYEGYHWFYNPGVGTGVIPTNDGEACVFVGFAPSEFFAGRKEGLGRLFERMLERGSLELADRVRSTGQTLKLRGFPGAPGVLRRAVGPGWALVGDAGYFKDPITAHGITDALRDAELLARAALHGTDEGLHQYQAVRDRLSVGLIEVTDRLASLDWTLEEAKSLHRALSREMGPEVEYLGGLGTPWTSADVANRSLRRSA